MKPYYQDSLCTIYHGDCREVVQGLKGDFLTVTDPPFNIGYHYAGYADKLKRHDYLDLLKKTCLKPLVLIHYMEELFAFSNELKTPPDRVVAWVYPSNTPRQMRGLAWFGAKPDFRLEGQAYKNPTDKRIAKRIAAGKKAKLYDWWEINQVKNVSAEKTAHPCQMPVEVMRRAIAITPKPGLVFEPFLGSGTTLVAAKMLGRKSIGVDIQEKYCEIAAKRLRKEPA